jgi:hypothetical protein
MTQASLASPADNPRQKQRTPTRGLTQAYELRDLAHREAIAIEQEQVSGLKDRIARAKALQALGNLWLVTTERIRIFRQRGLPKNVPAVNDPARQREKRRRPAGPLWPSA